MIKITNKQRGPVQVVIRSRRAPRSLTCLNIPGVGSGKNVYLLEDERATEYIERAEVQGLISTQHVPNKLDKGD